MKNYKKWTGEQRQKSLNLTNKAKKLGYLVEAEQKNIEAIYPVKLSEAEPKRY
mgnify:CR=1 FL=1